jgi:hypothetical protein
MDAPAQERYQTNSSAGGVGRQQIGRW